MGTSRKYGTLAREKTGSIDAEIMEYQDHVEWAYKAGIVTADKAQECFTASIQSEVNFFNSVARCQPAESSALPWSGSVNDSYLKNSPWFVGSFQLRVIRIQV